MRRGDPRRSGGQYLCRCQTRHREHSHQENPSTPWPNVAHTARHGHRHSSRATHAAHACSRGHRPSRWRPGREAGSAHVAFNTWTTPRPAGALPPDGCANNSTPTGWMAALAVGVQGLVQRLCGAGWGAARKPATCPACGACVFNAASPACATCGVNPPCVPCPKVSQDPGFTDDERIRPIGFGHGGQTGALPIRDRMQPVGLMCADWHRGYRAGATTPANKSLNWRNGRWARCWPRWRPASASGGVQTRAIRLGSPQALMMRAGAMPRQPGALACLTGGGLRSRNWW